MKKMYSFFIYILLNNMTKFVILAMLS